MKGFVINNNGKLVCRRMIKTYIRKKHNPIEPPFIVFLIKKYRSIWG